MSQMKEKDLEYNEPGEDASDRVVPVLDSNVVREEDLANESGRLFRWLGKAFENKVEIRGIERVPEDERDYKDFIGLLLFWWSVNMVISTLPIGLLAQAYFTLTFQSAAASFIVFGAIGSACCGFIATLGPKTGLRTMVISRYSVGFVGGSMFAVLNILTQLGFSVTAVILGGQILTSVSNGKLPLAASVVLIGVIALILCFFGYGVMHQYERYAWIMMFIFYLCMYGLGGKAGFDVGAQKPLQDTGLAYAGDFLTFGGIVFSGTAGWAPLAADFNCRLPANTSPVKVFILTWFGLMVPLVFCNSLGAALMTVPAYSAAFEAGDAGGLIAAVFEPWGNGGQFIKVMLSFSVISNCVPNTYSAALSVQTLCPLFQRVPRAVWTIVVFAIYTVAAVAGREHFSEILSNFLSVLGYWIAFFIVVVAEEHLIFRAYVIPGGYDLTAYNDIKRLPWGAAGIFSCLCGTALAIVSMAQTWYIGPLGAVFGEYGGDLGFEMSAIATAIVYPPLRYLEYKHVGR